MPSRGFLGVTRGRPAAPIHPATSLAVPAGSALACRLVRHPLGSYCWPDLSQTGTQDGESARSERQAHVRLMIDRSRGSKDGERTQKLDEENASIDTAQRILI